MSNVYCGVLAWQPVVYLMAWTLHLRGAAKNSSLEFIRLKREGIVLNRLGIRGRPTDGAKLYICTEIAMNEDIREWGQRECSAYTLTSNDRCYKLVIIIHESL